ncbi:hypothetical protein [Citreimonas salinaria]|uniref:Clp protease n=1 Tax=Citreimonas salinaria TaxID=321339 RepID=A0A1H3FYF5_9RHOB|nr:hypothetical protein [Citreimonas salinaria]SDX95139.1 hypothetical protein SAMN05444340_1028 [Citreimonas salinaria]
MPRNAIARTLMGVLIFQLGIAAFLILGDMRLGRIGIPDFGPDAPGLTEPVRPGDQRRTYAPRRDRPAVLPARDPGNLPDRLVLTPEDGPTWRLEGEIAEGDAARIADLLAEADPPIETLILQSPGGTVSEALVLGRALRRLGIATRMLSGEYCLSACPYLLAGGVTRQVHPDASVGVHQHFYGRNVLLPAFVAVEDIQISQAEVMDYLDEMGIDPMVMRHGLGTPPDEIYILVPDELERYGFTTPES